MNLMGMLDLIAAAKRNRRAISTSLFKHDNTSHQYFFGGLMQCNRVEAEHQTGVSFKKGQRKEVS